MSADSESLANPKDKLILIVEDDPSQLDLIKYHLGKEGFRLSDVSDGRLGVKKAEELNPDLIILDMMLPGLGGYEFIKEMQAAGQGSIPIVVLTARVLDRKLVEMLKQESNVKGFKQKPATSALGVELHALLGTRPPEKGL